MSGLILGIDPGLDVLGWGALTIESRPQVHDSGWFKSDPEQTDDERAAYVVRAAAKIIDRLQPRVIAVERYTYQGTRSHTQNAFRVGRVAGAIEGLAFIRGDHVLLERGRILSLIGARNDASKAQVKDLLRARFGRDVGTNEHSRDGVAVGLAGLLVWRQQQLGRTGT